jgi:hypothetical protein
MIKLIVLIGHLLTFGIDVFFLLVTFIKQSDTVFNFAFRLNQI